MFSAWHHASRCRTPLLPRSIVMCAQERQLAFHDWNATERVWGEPDTVHEVLLRQCRIKPDAVAVVDGNSRISCAELDKRSMNVAAALAAQGACCGATVAVGMDRSVDMVTALLGVWRAGCAYLPLDPDSGPHRLYDRGQRRVLHHKRCRQQRTICKL